MTKLLLVVTLAIALSGCHTLAWVAAHKEGVGLFALGAGAVASGENAVMGAWNLVDKARHEAGGEGKK